MTLSVLLTWVATAEAEGILVVAGGGAVPARALAVALNAAGGPKARVVILPQASNNQDRGESSVRGFEAVGAADITILSLDDQQQARRILGKADLIWFSGGKQQRLLAALRKASVIDVIRQRGAEGAVIGGTSAGAAALSRVMIAGTPERAALHPQNTRTYEGLGVAQSWLIDQHFVVRKRFGRLLSAVLDHPGMIGLGVGTDTAVVLEGRKMCVYGTGSVVVIDARQAVLEAVEADQPQLARDIRLHVLGPGSAFALDGMQTTEVEDQCASAIAGR